MCRCNHLHSWEVTLQTVLPSDNCMMSRSGGWGRGGKAHLGHTLKILFFYLVALPSYPAYGVYKDLKTQNEKVSLCCSVFFTNPSILSGYQCFETGKSYF